MTFNEKQLAFFKAHNIEATEENYAKLQETYNRYKSGELTDNDLGAVSGGIFGGFYSGASDTDIENYEVIFNQDVTPAR